MCEIYKEGGNHFVIRTKGNTKGLWQTTDTKRHSFITGLLAHFSLSILGISIATLFTRNIIKKASTAWLSLSFVLLITIASIRLKKEMPELLWVFPPINSFLMLGQYEHHLLVHVLWLTAWALIYSLLLITLFLFLVQKKRF